MYYDDDGGTLNFVVGMAIGAVAGAIIALLLAPQAGSRTRRKLLRSAENWGDAAGERLEYAAEDLKRAADDVRRAAEKSGGSLKKQVERGRKRLNM